MMKDIEHVHVNGISSGEESRASGRAKAIHVMPIELDSLFLQCINVGSDHLLAVVMILGVIAHVVPS